MLNTANGSKASETPRIQYSHKSAHRDTFFRKAPFKIFSTTVSVNFIDQAVECLFPTRFAQITLPSQGHYRVTLNSTLKSHFYGKNTYLKPGALISQCRASFAQTSEESIFRRDLFSDSFSVNGVYFEKATKRYIQKAPLAHRTTQSVEFEIIFYKDQIYMIQDNLIFAVLSFKDKILTTGKDKKTTETVLGERNL